MQEEFFCFKAPGVAGEGAVLADYAMAGDKDGCWVGSNGIGYGPHRLRASQSRCEFGVGEGLAVRDRSENRPYSLLKRSALGSEWQIKFPSLTPEITLDLTDGFR